MDLIHFEKQEGMLCAQHALNSLLQGAYFTVVDLADIAKRLDEQEHAFMAEGGIQSEEYQRFVEAGSQNMDDSGYFSVQVVSEALKCWNLDMVNIKSNTNPIAVAAQADPTELSAYICNFRQHWFSIRKFGYQWFNVNSMLPGPELISDTYLQMFLTQLDNDGYTIFVVSGDLPESPANDALTTNPVDPTVAASIKAHFDAISSASTSAGSPVTDGRNDTMLQNVLKASQEELDQSEPSLRRILSTTRREQMEAEDQALQTAMQESLRAMDEEEERKALALSLECLTNSNSPSASNPSSSNTLKATESNPKVNDNKNNSTNNDNKQQQQSTNDTAAPADTVQPSPRELRAKRAAFLEKLASGSTSQTDRSSSAVGNENSKQDESSPR